MDFWYVLVMSLSVWVHGNVVQYDPLSQYVFTDKPLMMELEGTIGYRNFYYGVSVITSAYSESPVSYWPFENTYVMRGGVNLGFIDIGIEHSCWHPMVAYQWVPERAQVVPSYEGGGTRIYAKLKLDSRERS